MRSYNFRANFPGKDSWLNDQYVAFFMKLTLIEAKVSLSKFNGNLFLLKYRSIDVFYRTIWPSNPAQFQFFPLPVRSLGYCGNFHLEHRVNVLLGGEDATHAMCSSFTVLLCLQRGLKF